MIRVLFVVVLLFSSFIVVMPAYTADLTLTGDGIWAETGDVADAEAGDNVDINDFTLTITNDGTADDGTFPGDLSWFTIGVITDSGIGVGDTGDVTITEPAAWAGIEELWVDITSATIGRDFTVQNSATSGLGIDVQMTGDLTAGNDIVITNNETEDCIVAIIVGGDLTAGGDVSLTAATGGEWGLTAGLAIAGDATATSFTLDDDTAGGLRSGAVLLFFADDGVTQTVTGTIDGAAADEGVVMVGAGGANNVTFADNIGSTAGLHEIEVATTGTATFGGDLSVTDLVFSENGVVDVTGTATIDTITTTAGSGTGDIELDGAGNVITGDIGAAGGELKLLNIDGTTTTNGNVYADQIDIAAATTLGGAAADKTVADTLNLQHAGLTTVSGTLNSVNGRTGTTISFTANGDLDIGGAANVASVTTNVAGTGDIEFQGGGITTVGTIGTALLDLDVVDFTGAGAYTLNGAVFANTVTVNNVSANVVIGASNTDAMTDLFLTAGSIDLGPYTTTLTAGDYTQAAATTLYTTVQNSSTIGKLVTPDAATIAAGTTLNVNVRANEYIRSNTTWTVVDGGAGGAVNAPAINDDSAILSFTSAAAGGGTDLTVTATRVMTYDKIASGNAGTAGAVLEQIGEAGATGDMALVLGELDSLPTFGAIAQALDTVIPVVDSGVTTASNTAMNGFTGRTMARLKDIFAKVRGYSAGETGVSAGSEMFERWEAWGQGYGEYLRQKPRGESNGYRAIVWGTAMGADTPVMQDKMRIGLSGGYSKGSINSKDNHGRTDADSYQGTVYCGYMDPENPYYVNGALSFAYNKYKGSRQINIGADSRSADSDYDGTQYSVMVDGGYAFGVGEFNLTPVASLQYQRLHLDSYTETNAGALSLNVAKQDYDFLESGLGVKLDRPFEYESRMVTPEVHAKWFYDFIVDRMQTTSTFTGGGGSFSTQGFDPAKSSYNIGAKLTMEMNENWSLETNYDYEFKDDFAGHTGWASARCRF
ncbi:MAG: autotransporter domain-containing protein [Candidatus Omnitrophota bacterium]